MSTQPKSFVTGDEYLEQERKADFRSEYFNGEVLAMSGGTHDHALIASNVMAELASALRDRDCRVRGSDMRVRTSPTGLYTYPDVVATCGQEEFYSDDTMVNPTLIVEVLSESTKNYDRGEKFECYRAIPSFREYLAVAQRKPHIEHYFRSAQGGAWTFREYSSLGDVVSLEALGVSITLTDVYRKVSWQKSDSKDNPDHTRSR